LVTNNILENSAPVVNLPPKVSDFAGIVDVISGDKPIQVEVDTAPIKNDVIDALPLIILGSMVLITFSVFVAMAMARKLG
jgi:hypothetical protein